MSSFSMPRKEIGNDYKDILAYIRKNWPGVKDTPFMLGRWLAYFPEIIYYVGVLEYKIQHPIIFENFTPQTRKTGVVIKVDDFTNPDVYWFTMYTEGDGPFFAYGNRQILNSLSPLDELFDDNDPCYNYAEKWRKRMEYNILNAETYCED